jgi:hypothetical protein
MNTEPFLFNFSKLKDTNVIADYQNELVDVWLDHINADTSGILEKSVNHGDGCHCCTRSPSDLIRGRRGRL